MGIEQELTDYLLATEPRFIRCRIQRADLQYEGNYRVQTLAANLDNTGRLASSEVFASDVLVEDREMWPYILEMMRSGFEELVAKG